MQQVKYLKTYKGKEYDTFKGAAIAKNIVSTDDEWESCLNEACTNHFPKAICSLFAYICIFHRSLNARFLYDKFKNHFYHPSMCNEVGEVFA